MAVVTLVVPAKDWNKSSDFLEISFQAVTSDISPESAPPTEAKAASMMTSPPSPSDSPLFSSSTTQEMLPSASIGIDGEYRYRGFMLNVDSVEEASCWNAGDNC